MGYFSKLDHTTKLGYQHQVISDIKNLKEEIGKKLSWIWKFIERLCNLVNLYLDYYDKIKGTSVSKLHTPSEDNILMIIFIDDLDRCEETTILKVYICLLNTPIPEGSLHDYWKKSICSNPSQ